VPLDDKSWVIGSGICHGDANKLFLFLQKCLLMSIGNKCLCNMHTSDQDFQDILYIIWLPSHMCPSHPWSLSHKTHRSNMGTTETSVTPTPVGQQPAGPANVKVSDCLL